VKREEMTKESEERNILVKIMDKEVKELPNV
jgi:hypothetical protein